MAPGASVWTDSISWPPGPHLGPDRVAFENSRVGWVHAGLDDRFGLHRAVTNSYGCLKQAVAAGSIEIHQHAICSDRGDSCFRRGHQARLIGRRDLLNLIGVVKVQAELVGAVLQIATRPLIGAVCLRRFHQLERSGVQRSQQQARR